MSNVLYFISEIPSLYVFVWEGGSSWHNHLPKCAKIHFSEFQILKFSRGKPPVPPMGRAHPPPMPSPPHRASGAWKVLKRLVTLLWRLLNFILLLLQNLGRTLLFLQTRITLSSLVLLMKGRNQMPFSRHKNNSETLTLNLIWHAMFQGPSDLCYTRNKLEGPISQGKRKTLS